MTRGAGCGSSARPDLWEPGGAGMQMSSRRIQEARQALTAGQQAGTHCLPE